MQRPRQSDGAGNAEHERPRAAVLPNGECQTKQGEQRKALKCIKSEAFEVSERDEPDSSNDSREERKAAWDSCRDEQGANGADAVKKSQQTLHGYRIRYYIQTLRLSN